VNAAAAFRAELLKLRKRPGVWILLATMAGTVLLFGYVLFYLLVTQLPDGELGGLDPSAVLDSLRPSELPVQVLGMVSGLGGAIGLILGGLAVGSEYGWRTTKTMVTQGPRRLPLMLGRLSAVLMMCLLLAVMAFLGGVAGTALVSLLEPGDAALPPAADLLAAFGVAALTISVWCAIGSCLAMLFRSTAWAIGLGLLYALAVEAIVGILPLAGDLGDVVNKALVGNNVAALVAATAPQSAATFGGPAIDIDAGQAVAVLLAYLFAAIGIATAVFIRRDIAT
jgi:ABC-type transport system involved in multi-copper enzyme maturation permease subunit